MTTRRIGVFGGTFDPIHCGHIDIGLAAESTLRLTRMFVIPANVSPLRAQPLASSYHRFAMVSFAVASRPGWRAADLELRSETPSYTSGTPWAQTTLAGPGGASLTAGLAAISKSNGEREVWWVGVDGSVHGAPFNPATARIASTACRNSSMCWAFAVVCPTTIVLSVNTVGKYAKAFVFVSGLPDVGVSTMSTAPTACAGVVTVILLVSPPPFV